jgi:hypothetical protein
LKTLNAFFAAIHPARYAAFPTMPPRKPSFKNKSSKPSDALDAAAKPRVRKIGSLVSQLMSRRGYAQSVVNEHLSASLAAAVDPILVPACQVGNLRAGILQVYVSDSVSLQELNFQKRRILKKMQAEVGGEKIIDIRFRVQAN